MGRNGRSSSAGNSPSANLCCHHRSPSQQQQSCCRLLEPTSSLNPTKDKTLTPEPKSSPARQTTLEGPQRFPISPFYAVTYSMRPHPHHQRQLSTYIRSSAKQPMCREPLHSFTECCGTFLRTFTCLALLHRRRWPSRFTLPHNPAFTPCEVAAGTTRPRNTRTLNVKFSYELFLNPTRSRPLPASGRLSSDLWSPENRSTGR